MQMQLFSRLISLFATLFSLNSLKVLLLVYCCDNSLEFELSFLGSVQPILHQDHSFTSNLYYDSELWHYYANISKLIIKSVVCQYVVYTNNYVMIFSFCTVLFNLLMSSNVWVVFFYVTVYKATRCDIIINP